MKSAFLAANRCFITAALLAALLVAACDGRRESREILNMPDMHSSTAFKAQEANPLSPTGGMMLPPEGTIPVNWQPYTISDADADTLAMQLENPFAPTREILLTGGKYYGIHCAPCHSSSGDGMGTVIRANAGMPIPPTLYSDKLVSEWTDGRMFHVITRGQGNMPAYASRIDAADRWAIIHYVRTIQAAAAATQTEDTTAEETAAADHAASTAN